MQDNFSIVILGATGDLAKKKLFPAIYRLMQTRKIGKKFSVIAASRRNYDKEGFLGFVKPHIKNLNKKTWKDFAKRVYYERIDFDEDDGFRQLGFFLTSSEKKHNTHGNTLFYLATLPNHFKNIAQKLKKYCINKNGFTRVVFEKPFGNDEQSAKKLNHEVSKVFSEKQIFRVDHYLGKDLVQNISIIRGTNRLFTPLWNSENVDHVQINLIENFGVENRGNFYDNQGALKDVAQSHLLQLLCLIGMEIPSNLDASSIRQEKVKLLKAVRKIRKQDVVLGQYKGYSKESGVKQNSKTETFFAVKLYVENKRWKGTPFYLRSGKSLAKTFASIYIQFKGLNKTIFNGEKIEPNYIVIQIQPDDGMLVKINGKLPGKKMKITPMKLTFSHERSFKPNTTEAYETIVYDALEGDQSAFIRSDEIIQSWKIIDWITKNKPKVFGYTKGSFGPKKADKFLLKDKREWFNKIENVAQ
ncbi:MAG TPA: glucose-6-phosphate dehydrogenase [archaeon]|nr:glucose-6-phosphate dehydrogenase [archaeon]